MRIKATIPDRHQNQEPNPGDKMSDGTIFIGTHGDKDWFAAAEDAKDDTGRKLRLNFSRAAEYAKKSKAHGHDDWRLPPGRDDLGGIDILDEMYNHRDTGAFKGSFEQSGTHITSWYWSSSPRSNNAYSGVAVRRFTKGTGGRGWFSKEVQTSVRCVRAVKRYKFK